MAKTADETSRRHLTGCVRAFLSGKKTLNWVMATIRGSRLPQAVLEEILADAKSGADRARYDELVSACRGRGLL